MLGVSNRARLSAQLVAYRPQSPAQLGDAVRNLKSPLHGLLLLSNGEDFTAPGSACEDLLVTRH